MSRPGINQAQFLSPNQVPNSRGLSDIDLWLSKSKNALPDSLKKEACVPFAILEIQSPFWLKTGRSSDQVVRQTSKIHKNTQKKEEQKDS